MDRKKKLDEMTSEELEKELMGAVEELRRQLQGFSRNKLEIMRTLSEALESVSQDEVCKDKANRMLAIMNENGGAPMALGLQMTLSFLGGVMDMAKGCPADTDAVRDAIKELVLQYMEFPGSGKVEKAVVVPVGPGSEAVN